MSKILFLGNGMLRTVGGSSWDDLLKRLSEREDLDYESMKSPMPLRAILLSNNKVQSKLSILSKDSHSCLYGMSGMGLQPPIKELASAGVKDIITTNYSYEIEKALLSKDQLSIGQLGKIQNTSTGRADKVYCIKSYNEAAGIKVWHIHGQARKSSSILLDHEAYCRFLFRIQDYLRNKGKKYETDEDYIKGYRKSWIDKFILDDVYFLGFGLDYSEIDLWWLLQRKHRQPNRGRTIFIDPKDLGRGSKEKTELLNVMSVEIQDFGFDLTAKSKKEREQLYCDFYAKALEYLANQ